MKATAKQGTTTNVKPMNGNGEIFTLSNGEYVYGNLSIQKTDIVNVFVIYNSNGTIKKEFSQPYKVFIGNNLIVTNETEPEIPTEPEEPTTDPDPEPVFPESYILTDPNGKRAEYVFVRIIE